MNAAEEKTVLSDKPMTLGASKHRALALALFLLAALIALASGLAGPVGASAKTPSAPQNCVWENSAATAQSHPIQMPQSLELQRENSIGRYNDASGCTLAAESTAQQPIYVLGRQVDTAVAKDWASHSVLDIPNWTVAKNDAWIQNIIDTRGTVYLGSPQAQATLWNAGRSEPTIFARELAQLRAAGYTQVGDYMHPLVK